MKSQNDFMGSYAARINYLQRTELDEQSLAIREDEVKRAICTAVDLSSSLPVWLAKFHTIARIQSATNTNESDNDYLTKDILAGLNGLCIPIYFLVYGQKNSIQLFVGTETSDQGEMCGRSLTANIRVKNYGLKKIYPPMTKMRLKSRNC